MSLGGNERRKVWRRGCHAVKYRITLNYKSAEMCSLRHQPVPAIRAHLSELWTLVLPSLFKPISTPRKSMANHQQLEYISTFLPEATQGYIKCHLEEAWLEICSWGMPPLVIPLFLERLSSSYCTLRWKVSSLHQSWRLVTEMKVQLQKNYPWAVTAFHEYFIATTTHAFNFQGWEALLKPNLNSPWEHLCFIDMCQYRLSPFGFNSFGLTTRQCEKTNEKAYANRTGQTCTIVCLFVWMYICVWCAYMCIHVHMCMSVTDI